MKTKKEIQEVLIKRYLRNKKLFKIMRICILICLGYVIGAYLDHYGAYTHAWDLIAEYSFIAFGIVVILSYVSKIDIAKEQGRLNTGIQENKNEIERLRKRITNVSDNYSEDDLKILMKIKKLEKENIKIQWELDVIIPKD